MMDTAITAEAAASQLAAAAEELIGVARPRRGQIFVLGCSSSEVLGQRIGSGGSSSLAEAMLPALKAVCDRHGLYLAVQCCEHLNRSLVVEAETAGRYALTEVTVRPVPHAGGAMAAAAFENFAKPVVVESIAAHLGLDVGQTLIGMHLRRVAVPVRLSCKKIGAAVLTAARTRPPLVGGPRAQYLNDRP